MLDGSLSCNADEEFTGSIRLSWFSVVITTSSLVPEAVSWLLALLVANGIFTTEVLAGCERFVAGGGLSPSNFDPGFPS